MFLIIGHIIATYVAHSREVRRLLKVILHIGAHRTGTTTLQRALYQNEHNLRQNGVSFWGPRATRGGLFSGLLNNDPARIKRNVGLISIEMERLAAKGQHTLIVSEENIMGSPRRNLREQRLYANLRDRLAGFHDAFGAQCTRVVLGIRAYDSFWASTLAYAIPGGSSAPCEDDLDRLVTQPRGWRRVIADVAGAFPASELCVWDFDDMIGNPGAQFNALNGGATSGFHPVAGRHNASPDIDVLRRILTDRDDHAGVANLGERIGRYMPFGQHHRDVLRLQYNEDLAWLRNGADGLAVFKEALDQKGPVRLRYKSGTKNRRTA